jgi:hypothetical protein
MEPALRAGAAERGEPRELPAEVAKQGLPVVVVARAAVNVQGSAAEVVDSMHNSYSAAHR